MPLDKKVIDIPFTGGINEGVDPMVLNAPALADVKRGRFDKQGGVRKRAGTEAVSGASLPTATSGANLISSRKKHPVAYGRGGLYVYSETKDDWYDTGIPDIPPTELEVIHNIGTFETTLHYDAASDGDFIVEVWEAEGTAWYRVTDRVNDTLIVQPQAIETIIEKPQVVYHTSGGVFLIFGEDTSNNLRCRIFSAVSLSFTGTTTIIASVGWWGCTYEGTGDDAYVAYATTAGKLLTLVDVTAAGVTTTARSSGLTADLAVSVHHDTVNSFVYATGVNSSSQDTVVCKMPEDLSATTATSSGRLGFSKSTSDTARTACVTNSDGNLFIASSYEDDTANRQETVWQIIPASLSGDTTASRTTYHHILATQAFRPDNFGPCIGLQYDFQGGSVTNARVDPHIIVVMIDEESETVNGQTYVATGTVGSFPIIVGYLNVGQAGAHSSQDGQMPHVTNVTSADWYIPTLVFLGFETYNRITRLPGDGRTGLAEKTDIFYTIPRLWKMDVEPPPLSHKAVGDELMVSGGFLSTFDGTSLFENAPLAFPESMSNAQTTGSGGLNSDATYYWTVLWVCRDSTGLVHRSAPSVEISADGPGGGTSWFQTVAFTVPQISHLRPEFGTYWSAQLFQRSSLASSATYRLSTEQYISPGSESVTFTPGSGSPTETGDRVTTLYTEGRVLENRQPPAFLDFRVGPRRAMGISAENPHQIYVTKLSEYGVAFEFNANLAVEISPHVQFTSLGVLDEKFVLFTEDNVFVMGGDGPDNTGQGSFGAPRLINSDTGCIDKRSVVEGPFGVIFRGRRGFYKIDRGLNLQYIGGPTEDSVDGVTMHSAVIVSKEQEIRWGTTDNIQVIYNYARDTWHIEEETSNFQHAAEIDGRYHWLKNSSSGWAVGKDRLASDAEFTESRSGIANSMVLETAWIKPAGLQAFKRVWWVHILGRAKDLQGSGAVVPGSVQVDLYYDYDDSSSDSYSISLPEATYPAETPLFLKIKPGRQKCTALKVKLTEIPAATLGEPGVPVYSEGFMITGIALELGVLPGGHRDTNTKR